MHLVEMPPLRAIIADDDPLSRYVLNVLLSEANVNVVAEATDGASLVRAAKTVEHDLIITDVFMREMGGVEAVHALYGQGVRKPLVFVSAKAGLRDVKEFPHAVLVPKPLWSTQLKAALPAAFQRFHQYLRSLPDDQGSVETARFQRQR